MMISIMAALMLQTSPLIPAQCSVNGGGPVPCQIQVRQESNGYLGIGFAIGNHIVVFGGNKIDTKTSTAELVTINNSNVVMKNGVCLVEEPMIGCRGIVAGEVFSVIAQTND
jgi:hypothetical protein